MSYFDFMKKIAEEVNEEQNLPVQIEVKPKENLKKQRTLPLDQVIGKKTEEIVSDKRPIKNKQTRQEPINYLLELKYKLIWKIKKQWLTPNPNKKYLAVTEVAGCPMQVWLKLSGNIKEEDLDQSKIFYLLDVYARIGDTVHNYIYKHMKFDHTEKYVKDDKHMIRGKFDIIDKGNLIDLKSSMNKSDCSGQLALYLHLARLNGYEINRTFIWWVMQDELEEYDIHYLEIIIEDYLERAKVIRESLKTNTPPKIVDESQCKYCLVKRKCDSIRQAQTINKEEKKFPDNDQPITFDVIL